MVTWLMRQEAVDLHAAYIAWLHDIENGEVEDSTTSESSDSEDELCLLRARKHVPTQ